MSAVLFAWELGAGMGHAMACATLARALEAQGHRCSFAFREPLTLRSLGFEDHAVFQAPLCAHEGQGHPTPIAWPDVLAGCGYARPDDLAMLVAAWIEIVRASHAQLLVAEYAPTALLAARILGIPRVSFGNGFSVPPRLSPMPAFRVDVPVDAAALAAREALILENVNEVLARWKVPPLRALHEHLEVAEQFLCTFPELDHYGQRPLSTYWGPHYSIDMGSDIAWPQGEGPRVLVYLHRSLAPIDAIIDMLVANRCRVVAHIPGLEPVARAKLESTQRRVSDGPIRLRPLLRECDLLLDHGGTVAAGAVMEGAPQLLFPAQYEQLLAAARCEQLGVAMKVLPGEPASRVHGAFAQALLASPHLRAAANAVRRRYATFSPAEQEKRIVARIEQILAGAAA